MSAKHTPGPWTFDVGTGWLCGDAKSVARVFQCNPAMGFPLAPQRAEADANGHLIAAAPEMLEALKALLQHCVTPRGLPDKNKGRTAEQQAAYDATRIAIAKAEGM